MDALAPRVRQQRHRVLPVHAARVAEDGGEGGHPARLFAGTDLGRKLLPVHPGVEEDLQRVQGVEGVPDPVIGPERHATVIVNLAIPGAEGTAVLRDGDHRLVRLMLGNVGTSRCEMVPMRVYKADNRSIRSTLRSVVA